MCGIIGFCGPNSPETRKLLANLITESSYRGKHSTGLCWVNHLKEFHLAFPELLGDDLEQYLELAFYELTDLQVIAHTRYCTSDPDSPLPIIDGSDAIVLNGVVTQEPFESWPAFGPLPYTSRNDAEIMLRLAKQGQVDKTPGSYAACFLNTEGLITGVRSPERPLWCHSFQWPVEVGCGKTRADTAYAFTSTLDIALRSDPERTRKASREMKPGTLVCLNDGACPAKWETPPDLQIRSLNPPVAPCKL